MELTVAAIVLLIIFVTVCIVLRALYIIYLIYSSNCKLVKEGNSLKTICCIGSGGHTSELLRLIKSFGNKKFQPRLYVMADNDISSEAKIVQVENEMGNNNYTISKIPRSRNVHQSFKSSVGSTLRAIMYTLPLIYKFKPDVILCNGPGTCIPICLVSFMFRCFWLLDCRIIFVESICRVRSLSLTGKILQYFADIVVVQWPQLRDVCFRAKYFGRLT